MYLAQGAIISLDLGKRHIIDKYTSDDLKEKIQRTIVYFFKKEVAQNNLRFIDFTPYNEFFISNGEKLKSIVKRVNRSESDLHITLNVDFSKSNEIFCFVEEFDSKSRKFAENICSFFELSNYKNKGVKNAEVYNLLYVDKPSIIIDLNLNIKDESEVVEKGECIAKTLVESILTLGTK
ncbi:hypothetical protein LTX21_000235 [Clostridium perfringens]|nr:hypothetical protein CPBEC3_02630 [Clostridium perfringens]HCG3171300.1 hypothetical protein [Clostridium perfringens]